MTYLMRNPTPLTSVAHYYGDVVRWLFLAAAAAMLLAHPFYANLLRVELPFTLTGALVLIVLAALTNPHNKGIITADAVAAGVGMLIYQAWALFEYDQSTWLEIGLREAIALLFMTALYFSLKTLRSMLLGKIGRSYEPGEFDSERVAEDRETASVRTTEEDSDEPVNPYLRPRKRESSSADAEYEEKRKKRMAEESLRRDQELENLVEGRE